MGDSNGQDGEWWPRDYVIADRGSATANASIKDSLGKSGAIAVWLGLTGCVLGAVGFTLGLVALVNTSGIMSMAEQTGRAAAKAETATARANVAEIYAKQLFTEMNRLGYPIRTPAEEHSPQPPETAIPENPQ